MPVVGAAIVPFVILGEVDLKFTFGLLSSAKIYLLSSRWKRDDIFGESSKCHIAGWNELSSVVLLFYVRLNI